MPWDLTSGDFFWWMGYGRVKKFYLYSKREAEVLIIFFPSFFALPLLFCPVCIFSFLFFPLHSSPICYQPLTEFYSSVLSPHMLFDTHRIPLILGLCLFYVSLPPICFLLSSLPSLSWSQQYRPYSSFLGSGWKLVPGRTRLEVFLGLRSWGLSLIGVWSGPWDPWGTFHFTFKVFFQYHFSQCFLTHEGTLFFSPDNEQNQGILGCRVTSHLISQVRK